MNKIILVGRTTKDVDLRYSQSTNPIAIARVGLAVKRDYKREGEPDTDFFNLTLYGKQAENFQKYATKGRLISIVGRIQFNTWEKDGVKKTGHEVTVESFELLGSKNDTPRANDKPSGSVSGFMPTYDEDDDLPF